MALVAFILVSGYLSVAFAGHVDGTSVGKVVRGNNKLAGKLFQLINANRKDENFVFCPLCITTNLAQMSLGASGETLESLQDAMGLKGAPEEEYLPAFGHLTKTYKKDVKVTKALMETLLIGNSVDPGYVQNLKQYFNASIQHMDVANFSVMQSIHCHLNDSSTKMDKKLHKLVLESETQELFKDLNKRKNQIIPVTYFDFEAEWEKRFSFSQTTEEPFFTSNEEILPAKMMRQTGHFHIVNFPQLDAKAIALPYVICDGFNLFSELPPANRTLRSRPKRRKKSCKSGVRDSRLQLVILLPNSYSDGLSVLESKLKPEMLAKIPGKFDYKTYLDISFPKVKIAVKENWVRYTDELGLKDLSSDKADFTRMSGSQNDLKLGQALSFTSFVAREKGSFTKSSVLKTRPLAREPTLVKVDHPFIGFVHDKKTDAILLVLKVLRPTY